MRRPRENRDWWFYGMASLCALLSVWLVVSCVERSVLLREINGIDSTVEEAPATGGAEVPVPVLTPSFDWTFPIAPEDYRVLTSPFGHRISPILKVEMYHQGLDIAATWRAQVVAAADGVVVENWPPPDGYWRGHDVLGGMIMIEHADGMRTQYAHLSWSRVRTGDVVRAGEVIGRVGDTGKSDGEHLHFATIQADGTFVNPLLYVEP